MRSSRSFCLFVIPHFLPCADGTEYCGGNGYYHFDYYFPVGCVEFAHVSVVFEFLVVIYREGAIPVVPRASLPCRCPLP